MIETILSTVKDFQWTGLMGILLYWVPFAICAVGYTLRTIRSISHDIKRRKILEDYLIESATFKGDEEHKYRLNAPYYKPTDTVGTIICRVLATVIPVVNMWCALTDVAVIHRIFTIIGSIFSQPLVPKR